MTTSDYDLIVPVAEGTDTPPRDTTAEAFQASVDDCIRRTQATIARRFAALRAARRSPS